MAGIKSPELRLVVAWSAGEVLDVSVGIELGAAQADSRQTRLTAMQNFRLPWRCLSRSSFVLSVLLDFMDLAVYNLFLRLMD